MAHCIISLGSNVGDTFQNLSIAQDLVHQQLGSVLRESSDYETEAWGNTNQDDYANKVIMIDTPYEPTKVLEIIQDIEAKMGRIKAKKWDPRIIDLDILFYEDLIFENERLIIPHPYISSRRFILKPLMDIDPNFIHPIFKKTIRELYIGCPDTSKVCEMVSVY